MKQGHDLLQALTDTGKYNCYEEWVKHVTRLAAAYRNKKFVSASFDKLGSDLVKVGGDCWIVFGFVRMCVFLCACGIVLLSSYVGLP